MKNLLSLIGIITLLGTSNGSIIPCDNNSTSQQKENLVDVIKKTNFDVITTDFLKKPD